MKKFIKETPHLAAGFIAFLIGAILMVPAYVGISYWTAPRAAGVGTWDDFEKSQSNKTVEAIRVYEEQKMFQYSTGDNRWISVQKGSHQMRDFDNVSYPLEQKTHLLIMAALAFFAIGPFLAMASKVQKYADAIPDEGRDLSPCAAGPQVSAQPPQQQSEPQSPPVQRPIKKAPEQNKPAAPEDVTASAKINVAAFGDKSITFKDIAGYQTTKESMQFIVNCLTHPELLAQTGAKVPSGILLYGPPGTGKTLMARAIAGSAGVSFFSANASEFMQRWVGVGAENVRALYEEARAHAPSIVFIDEIDAIGGQRDSETNGEHRLTLNALLSEMDGISKDAGVITIAATNAFESLDSALVRAGRFDRKIMVPLPAYEDRLEIIRLYAKKRSLSSDVSLENVAKHTTGMSGSELSTLFNEAALQAVQGGRGVVTAADLDSAITRMLTNGEATKSSNKKDLEAAAYHEAGHTVILKLLANNAVPKVSIIGSTSGFVGLTIQTEGEERQLMPVHQLRSLIMASYGGRAAEELVFGKDAVTTGARQDIQRASGLIREYLQHGAGNSLLDVEAFSGRSGMVDNMNEAKNLSAELYAATIEFLSDHRELLERIAKELLDKETLTEEELNALF